LQLSPLVSSWTRWRPSAKDAAVAAADGVHGERLPLSA
jgi:hypothetical protein